MTRNRWIGAAVGGLLGLGALWFAWAWLTVPSDRTPQGAYLRVVIAVNRNRAQDFFAYLEQPARHACYTIRAYRKKARDRVLASYPEPKRSELARAYAGEAEAKTAADVFALEARRRGWMALLRRDLSGVQSVEINGDRATVQTVHGTRYSFRRRHNGIWGLTLFTATLLSDAEKAARDDAMIEKAANDYDRAHHKLPPH